MSVTYEYPRPAVTVDAVIVSSNHPSGILLIQRRNPPFQNRWALPGGFLDVGEDPQAAAARELEEETGLHGIDLTQIGAFGAPDRDPREHIISIAYLGLVDRNNHAPKANDDAREAAWFPLASLPPLAFDHDRIIAKAVTLL